MASRASGVVMPSPTPAARVQTGGNDSKLWSRLVGAVQAHPVAAGVVVVGIGAVAYVVYTALFPPEPWRKEAGEGRLHGDAAVSGGLAAAAEALVELGATGIISAEEGEALTKEFLDVVQARAKPSADGVPRLDRAACRFVFAKMGVTDGALADRIFDSWDTDGTGSLDMKEFLHAIVLVLRGGRSDKLNTVFDIMDANGDGHISQGEMVQFLKTVYQLQGKRRTEDMLKRQVDTMFHSLPKLTRPGRLSRSEFMELANQTKYHLGEQLTEFLTTLQRKFNATLPEAARSSGMAIASTMFQVEGAGVPRADAGRGNASPVSPPPLRAEV